LKDTYCNEPYRTVHYDGKGLLGPCCTYRGKRPNITNVEEYWSSEWLEDFRNLLNNGVRDPGCANCWKKEDRGERSQRIEKNEKHGHVTEPNIKELFLSFGNICNKSCGICRPQRSSLVAKEWRNVDIDNPWLSMMLNGRTPSEVKWMQSDFAGTYIQSIDDYYKALHLTETVILDGGEAFITQQCNELLDYMIDNGLTDKSISAVTNGSVTVDQLEKLKKFKHVSFTLSIDGIKELYPVVRPPHSWEWWNQQHDLILGYDIKINYACVAHAFNIHQLPEILDYFVSYNNNINFSAVNGQPHLGPNVVPDHVLDKTINELKERLTSIPSKYTTNVKNLITNLESGYNKDSKMEKMFERYVQTFSHKGYRETIPWLKEKYENSNI
jgi:hypothetical protein